MTPPLAAPDRQLKWSPTWVFSCPALPHVYAGRDTSIPSVLGDPVITGDSEVGGPDYVGGGAGPDAIHAWGRITRSPTVTRRISDPFWPVVDIADVTIQLSEVLTDDYAAEPFTLSRYDAATGLRLYELHGVITNVVCERDGTTITGTSADAAILEEPIPTGTITTARFPQADPSVLGQTPTWLFGNVTSLPLPCVRDDQVTSCFDYLVCRGDVAALTGLRRLSRNPDDPAQASFTIDFMELEPYPGMDGVGANLRLEGWDAGPTSVPDDWTLTGTTPAVAKNTTAGQFSEGTASASVTTSGVGGVTRLAQNLMLNAPDLPLSWWRGREISLVMDIRSVDATRVRAEIDDGVAVGLSTFHTGGGTFEPLTVGTVGVPFVVDAAATKVEIAFRLAAGAAITAQVDHVRVYLRAKSWAEIPRPDLYDGNTAVRFFFRQEDGAGSLYPIVADVHGLQPERNPVRAIRTLLSDATHGLGRTVDADSFDAGEIAACLTHEAAVLLDGPELFAPISQAWISRTAQTLVIHDHSGHARHGLYDKGAGAILRVSGGGPSGSVNDNDAYINDSTDGHWVEWPSDPAYSGQAISVRVGLQIPTGGLPDAAAYPILEKTIGGVWFSQYTLYRQSNALAFAIRSTDTNLYFVTSPLVDGTDENRWMDIVARAEAGVLTLYRDGVLAATGSYSGSIAEGDGPLLLAKFGTGSVQFGEDRYDNVTLYSQALSPARIAALHDALPLDAEPVGWYTGALITTPNPEFIYRCDEDLGATVMDDGLFGVRDGAWVGGPTLGVPGLLSRERGFVNRGSAVRFANNVSQYGIETGMTLADAAGTLAVWYRPAALGVNAGLVEKCIGTGAAAARGTQWSLCQRKIPGANVIRFTRVTTAGTFTVDVPLVAEDLGRAMWLVAVWRNSDGTLRLSKNGGKRALEGLTVSTTYTGTAVSGVGDFLVGIQGTVAGVRTRPAQGDLAFISYTPVVVTNAEVETNWTAATWYNGGLFVDLAMREPRPAVDWLAWIAQLRGIRLGFTPAGTITVSVDAAPPSSILIDARDGPGDGARNLVAIGGRTRPALQDRVRDVVVKYRRDLVTGDYLGEVRRSVSTKLDAQGRRIGRDHVFTLDAVREHPCADRFADYAGKRLAAAEQGGVDVTLHQEARRLMEADLVQVTEAILGYNADVLEVREVRKALATIEATLQGWDEGIYTYAPAAFPSGATSG